AWKIMIPLSVVNILMVMFCLHFQASHLWLMVGSVLMFICWGVVGTSHRRVQLQGGTARTMVSHAVSSAHSTAGKH
ncbi:MAG: hypothetical protein ACK50J_05355, partial [Planctomyces sp.]